VFDEAAAYAKAKAEGKGVMVDFAATWCIPCGELELTFADDKIADQIRNNFVPLKFDVSNDDDISSERRDRYKAGTLPSVVYRSADGRDVGRINRLMQPDELSGVLDSAIKQLHGGVVASAADCKKP
jgi:thiol:disulfide interchange protein